MIPVIIFPLTILRFFQSVYRQPEAKAVGETEGWKCFPNWKKNCLPGPRKSQYDLLSDDTQECCIRGFSAKIMFSVLICVLMCKLSLPLSPILLDHQTEGSTGHRKALWSRFILLSRSPWIGDRLSSSPHTIHGPFCALFSTSIKWKQSCLPCPYVCQVKEAFTWTEDLIFIQTQNSN